MAYAVLNPYDFASQNPLSAFYTGMQAIPQEQILNAQAQYAAQQQQAAVAQTQAQTQNILQGQIPLQQAEASEAGQRGGYYGQLGTSQGLQNTFLQQNPQYLNPNAMVQGIASLNYLAQNDPQAFQLTTGMNPQTFLQGNADVQAQAVQAAQSKGANIQNIPAGAPGSAPMVGGTLAAGQSNLPMSYAQIQRLNSMFGNAGQGGIGANAVPGQAGLPAISPAQVVMNKAMGLPPLGIQGQPQYEAYAQGLKTAASQNAQSLQEYLNQANEDSANATNLINSGREFLANYDKSTYRGPAAGALPVKGLWSALVPGNLTPEQNTDAAASQMQAAYGRLTFPSRVTNVDLHLAGTAKPSRESTPESAHENAEYIIQQAQRIREEPDFANYAMNSYGITNRDQLASLFNNYQSDRPVFNFKSGKPIDQNLNSFKDYLQQRLGPPVYSQLPTMTGAINPQNPQGLGVQTAHDPLGWR